MNIVVRKIGFQFTLEHKSVLLALEGSLAILPRVSVAPPGDPPNIGASGIVVDAVFVVVVVVVVRFHSSSPF